MLLGLGRLQDVYKILKSCDSPDCQPFQDRLRCCYPQTHCKIRVSRNLCLSDSVSKFFSEPTFQGDIPAGPSESLKPKLTVSSMQ